MKENKQGRKLVIGMIVLIIILISLISFVGIYVENKGKMVNKLPDYLLGMDLKGNRVINLNIDESTNEVIKDAEGNVIESATDEEIQQNGYIKESVPVNSKESLNSENYQVSKNIIENRLKELKVSNYIVRQNNDNGNIVIELKEDTQTDNIISSISEVGKFEIQDSNTKEVLMDNSSLKGAKVLYQNSQIGMNVYLNIQFNKEGRKKLEEISRNYTSTTDEEGNTTEKKITMTLDGQTIISTSFDEPITTGEIPLSIGNSSTSSSEDVADYIKQANTMAMILNNGKMPITYTIKGNKYIQSDISKNDVKKVIFVVGIIALVMLIYLILKYKKQGLLSAISYVGLIATFLLIIRLTNVEISIEGIAGILLIGIINYIMLMILLKEIMKEQNMSKAIKSAIIKFSFTIVPIYIISIVFTFISYLPIYSFGMVMFWGITLILIYNMIFTRSLLLNSKEE